MVIRIKKNKINHLLPVYFTAALIVYFCLLGKIINNLYFFNHNVAIRDLHCIFCKKAFILVIVEIMIAIFLNIHAIVSYHVVEAFKKITIFAEHVNFDHLQPKILEYTYEPNIIRETFYTLNKMQKGVVNLFEKHTKNLAMIIHDLRTPLTRIKLRIQLLEDTHNIEKLVKNIDEIDYMLSDILWFARNTFERERKKWLDLSALLENLCEEYNDLGFVVHFKTQALPIHFFGKPRTLCRAFTNLIENALKHTNTKPIFVILKVINNDIFIIIRDQGQGIAPEDLAHVFKPYYKGKDSHMNGYGLGLAIVQDVITNHKGKISMRNHPKNGLEVCIVFSIDK